MIVTCSCGAKLKIGDDKLTEGGVRIKCPKCGLPHVVKKPMQAGAVPPAMPWFAHEPAESTLSPAEAAKPAQADVPALPTAPAMPWFASSPGLPTTSPAPSPAMVLVAHDSKVVVDMIRSVVSEAGLMVEHAPDGLDALKKASALRPQVMIVDVGLTGIYGFELCERLKGDPDTRGIKIILLSSVYGLTAYKRNPVTLYGADDYIEKHHIPDGLVPKIKDLLAGRTSSAKAVPAAAPEPAATAHLAPGTDAHLTTPSKQGTRPQPPASEAAVIPAGAPVQKPSMSDMPDVLPKVPVTLDGTRRIPSSSSVSSGAGPGTGTLAAAAPRPAPVVKAEPSKAVPARTAAKDESVKLDASFFEQDEYKTPEKAPVKIAADPEEIEKARRFARLVVSDIVLYNQESVAEGIAKGTFYELLKDDILEGRALYDKRVPEAIRSSKDYYQEAFDNFIAAKKKQR